MHAIVRCTILARPGGGLPKNAPLDHMTGKLQPPTMEWTSVAALSCIATERLLELVISGYCEQKNQ